MESIKMLKFEYIYNKWVDQNVEVWVKSGELIKMLKFEDKVGNQSYCWNVRTKLVIDQNVEIWVKHGESIKMLKFECKMSNPSECWNFGVKGEIIKVLKLSGNSGINQNVEVWVQ